MEGLRGFAVALVFIVHVTVVARPWMEGHPLLATIAEVVNKIGHSGVDLFFVLSGFLIYGSLMKAPQPFRAFMSKRVRRIYPAFLATFVLYLLLSWAFPAENKIPGTPVAGAAYLLANLLLLPGMFDIEPMNIVTWSLSFELFYYLMVPLLVSWAGLRERSVSWRVTLLCLIAVALVVAMPTHNERVRLVMFIAGMLLWEAIRARPDVRPAGWVGVLAIAVAFSSRSIPALDIAGNVSARVLLFGSWFLLCWATLHGQQKGTLVRIFSWTPMRWLGNMSYSFYLLHGAAIKGAFLLLAAVFPAREISAPLLLAFMAGVFVWALVPSFVLFAAVERPFSLR